MHVYIYTYEKSILNKTYMCISKYKYILKRILTSKIGKLSSIAQPSAAGLGLLKVHRRFVLSVKKGPQGQWWWEETLIAFLAGNSMNAHNESRRNVFFMIQIPFHDSRKNTSFFVTSCMIFDDPTCDQRLLNESDWRSHQFPFRGFSGLGQNDTAFCIFSFGWKNVNS